MAYRRVWFASSPCTLFLLLLPTRLPLCDRQDGTGQHFKAGQTGGEAW